MRLQYSKEDLRTFARVLASTKRNVPCDTNFVVDKVLLIELQPSLCVKVLKWLRAPPFGGQPRSRNPGLQRSERAFRCHRQRDVKIAR